MSDWLDSRISEDIHSMKLHKYLFPGLNSKQHITTTAYLMLKSKGLKCLLFRCCMYLILFRPLEISFQIGLEFCKVVQYPHSELSSQKISQTAFYVT